MPRAQLMQIDARPRICSSCGAAQRGAAERAKRRAPPPLRARAPLSSWRIPAAQVALLSVTATRQPRPGGHRTSPCSPALARLQTIWRRLLRGSSDAQQSGDGLQAIAVSQWPRAGWPRSRRGGAAAAARVARVCIRRRRSRRRRRTRRPYRRRRRQRWRRRAAAAAGCALGGAAAFRRSAGAQRGAAGGASGRVQCSAAWARMAPLSV